MGKATLQNATLISPDDSGLQIQFDIVRSGQKSTYGDFRLTHRSSEGKMTQIGLVRGVAVYSPVEKRSYSVPITLPEGFDLSDGELILDYLSQTKRNEILATLKLPVKQSISTK